ncbi:hypothetical protein BHM03_00016058 [Ensete ventricosum]|nr:hypothetical protein BHM03_00016058 [Ensete ventricosum]
MWPLPTPHRASVISDFWFATLAIHLRPSPLLGHTWTKHSSRIVCRLIQITPMNITNLERLHTKDNESEVKSTEVETSPVVTRVDQTPHMQSPRYSLGIWLNSDDVVGSHRKFARRFVEGNRKLARNAKRDSRKEDRRTCRKIVGGCQSIRDDSQQVSAGKPPRWRLDRPYHRLRATAND